MHAAFDIHPPIVRDKTMSEAEWRQLALPRMSLLQDSWAHKVYAFRRFYDRPISTIDVPLSEAEVQTHHKIITEEWKELWSGVMLDDVIETLDGGVDLIYTVLGLLIARGIPPHVIDAAMEEVHASNMTKADPTTGKPVLSPEGKILKGSAYVKADLLAAAADATPGFDLLPAGPQPE